MRRFSSVLVALVGLIVFPAEASAETVMLSVRSNGTEVQGDGSRLVAKSTAIECIVFEQVVDAGDAASGAREFHGRSNPPIKCLKKVDRASPVLASALMHHSPLDATFRFYRRRPDWKVEYFYEIRITDAQISSIHLAKSDKEQAVSLEEISFVYSDINWTFYRNGAVIQTTGTPKGLEPVREL